MNFEQLLHINTGSDLANTGLFFVVLPIIAVVGICALGFSMKASHKFKFWQKTSAIVGVFAIVFVTVFFSGTPNADAAGSISSTKDVVFDLSEQSSVVQDLNFQFGGIEPNGMKVYARTQNIDDTMVKIEVNDITIGPNAVLVKEVEGINPDNSVKIKASTLQTGYKTDGKIIYSVVQNTPDMSVYYNQAVSWEKCNDLAPDITEDGEVDGSANYECADIEVPVNWYNQNSVPITLAIARYVSPNSPTTHKGSLLLNPGGPGSSGIDAFISGGTGKDVHDGTYAELDAVNNLSNYDIVSWDPRGVGRSTQLVCNVSPDIDIELTNDTTMDQWWAFERQKSFALSQSCYNDSPISDLLFYMDTVTQAHDLDLLRSLVGDPKLNYLGMSWGTELGAAYTGVFPDKVGLMVLDGISPYSPSVNSPGVVRNNIARVHEFKNMLDDFLVHCMDETDVMWDDCKTFLTAGNVASLEAQFEAILARDFSLGHELFGMLLAGWNDQKQPQTAKEMREVIESHPSPESFDEEPQSVDGPSNDLSSGVNFNATECSSGTLTEADDQAAIGEIAEVFDSMPAFAKHIRTSAQIEYSSICSGFNARSTPDISYGNLDLPTVLLSYSAVDFNTPPALAMAVISQFPSTHYIVYDGAYHCAYSRSVDTMNAVNKFFMTGVLPTNGAHFPRRAYVALPSS